MEMAIEPTEFRRVLAHWATGVTVIATVTRAGEPRGMTASAFASVSLSPPLVLACVEQSADTYAALSEAGVFSINFLRTGMHDIAQRFAGDDTTGKFRDVAYRIGASGAPILDDALAWVDCRVHAVHEGGDHRIFIGIVIDGGTTDGEPLLYYRGRYGLFTP
jgi:flavin reductase (DIM6/NTAB) family NADH-FMN oxidoreductase RutF